MDQLVLLTPDEQKLRIDKLRAQMALSEIDSAIISSNANLFYLTGRVFSGYMYLPPEGADPVYFVKRPVHLIADMTISIRKPEGMLSELKVRSLPLPRRLGLELGNLTYVSAVRLARALEIDQEPLLNLSPALAMARATKTRSEINLITISGAKHERVYRKIPQLYQPGMSDIELQIEIERLSRLEGCLGQFRISGDDMEIHMGNLLAGNNADNPSPYDFAMGGEGQNPSLPIGANGTVLRPGMSVMVDMNGNFTGYMSDMSRTYSVGDIDERAMAAHQLSIDICRELAAMGRPGVEARALYDRAEAMAKEAGLHDYFMGHRQHAAFVGHGVGIEINELPVIAPRSKMLLEVGNAIALEPKFVIPGTGAVGVESTYIVSNNGMECITRAPLEIMQLDK